MKLDATTFILFGVAVLLGIAYFARRSARIKRQKRQI